jgi:hypothetical protein
MRVTNEVLATSPDQANKRGLATSGESASALGGSTPAYNVRNLHSFSARRFVPALGAWRANKRLQLTRPSVAQSWRSAVWRRSVSLRAVVGSAGPRS